MVILLKVRGEIVLKFFDRCKKYIIIAAVFGTFTTSYIFITENKANAYEISIGDKVVAYSIEDQKSLDIVNSLEQEIKNRFGASQLKESIAVNKVRVQEGSVVSDKALKQTILQNSKMEVEGCAILANKKQIGLVASENEGRQALDKLKDYYSAKSGLSIKESKLKTEITYSKQKDIISNIDSIDEVVERVKEANSRFKNPVVAFELKGTEEVKEVISPGTSVTTSDSIPAGQTKVQSSGKEGQKLVVKEVVMENNKVISTTALSEKVITEAQNKIVLQGKPKTAVAGLAYLTTPSRGTISSAFGARWGRMHEGIDIAANIGDPIYAALDGTVTYAGWETGYGNFIQIKHADGVLTAYGHCSKIQVAVGDTVKKGDKIGEVGNTGNSTGPHLHFEVRVNGVAKDPMAYLNK